MNIFSIDLTPGEIQCLRQSLDTITISGANLGGTHTANDLTFTLGNVLVNYGGTIGANTRLSLLTGTSSSLITGNLYTVTQTSTTGIGAITAGATNTLLSNTVAGMTANVNNYTQVTFQNLNTGTDATADFILTANNGNDTVNYGDFGIINSGYDNSTPTNSLGNIVFAADTYLYAQGNVSNTSQSGGNLVIGAATAAKTVKIFAGGNTASALILTVLSPLTSLVTYSA